MNHKRHRPKNARAGCLLCKPHKANGTPESVKAPPSDRRRMQTTVAEGVEDDFGKPHPDEIGVDIVDTVPAGYWDALGSLMSTLPKLPEEPPEPEEEPLI